MYKKENASYCFYVLLPQSHLQLCSRNPAAVSFSSLIPIPMFFLPTHSMIRASNPSRHSHWANQLIKTGKLMKDPHLVPSKFNSQSCPVSVATEYQLQPSFLPAHISFGFHSPLPLQPFSPHSLALSQPPTPVDIPC